MWSDNSRNNRPSRVSEGSAREAAIRGLHIKNLTQVVMSRYKWHNLPDGIDPRFIEKILHTQGLIVFFRDSFYDRHFAMKGTPSGIYNVYDNPTEFTAYGAGMVSRKLHYSPVESLKECVPIWASPTRTPSVDVVEIYADRLARVDMTLDVNAITARTPRVFKTTENQKLSTLNLQKQIEYGAEFVTISDQLADSVEVFDTSIDADIFEKMHTYRARLLNEFMDVIGVDAANTEKKERLVEGELDANGQRTFVSREVTLGTREQAVDEINERYGLNIEVEYVGGDSSDASNNEI